MLDKCGIGPSVRPVTPPTTAQVVLIGDWRGPEGKAENTQLRLDEEGHTIPGHYMKI